MNTTGIEEARFTFVYIQNITAGDIIEQLFDKRAFLYRDNAGRLKLHLEIILENQKPRNTQQSENTDTDGNRSDQNGQYFHDFESDIKSLLKHS